MTDLQASLFLKSEELYHTGDRKNAVVANKLTTIFINYAVVFKHNLKANSLL